MSLALILSSYVATSRIGGVVQQLVLARLGMDPVLVPTVMLGRSPALGATSHPTDPEVFASLIADVEAHGVFEACDLIITGHFSSAAQVEIAAAAIERTRQRSPIVRVIVDPVMGDAPKGLYVKPEVAQALAARLVPLADWITPNAWELERLTGVAIAGPVDVAAAQSLLAPNILATSTPAEDGAIGVVCRDGHGGCFLVHALAAGAPKGTGDLVTAVFGAGLIEGLAPQAAAAWAVRAALRAVAAGTADLPVAALSESLLAPGVEMRIEALP